MKFALALIGLVSVQAVHLKQKNHQQANLLAQLQDTPADIIKELDVNGDGKVSKKEFVDLLHA